MLEDRLPEDPAAAERSGGKERQQLFLAKGGLGESQADRTSARKVGIWTSRLSGWAAGFQALPTHDNCGRTCWPAGVSFAACRIRARRSTITTTRQEAIRTSSTKAKSR